MIFSRQWTQTKLDLDRIHSYPKVSGSGGLRDHLFRSVWL